MEKEKWIFRTFDLLPRVKTSLRNISRFLGRMPSMFYALIYLLLIPFFALVYDKIPEEFHHDTIRFENIKEKQEILKDIQEWIQGTFTDRHKSSEITIDGQQIKEFFDLHGRQISDNIGIIPHTMFSIEATSLKPFGLDLNSEEIQFYLPLDLKDKQGKSELHIAGRVKFQLPKPTDPSYGDEYVEALPISFYHEHMNLYYADKIFPVKVKGHEEELFMIVPHHVVSRIRRLRESFDMGRNDLEDSYWRMLYLSAVTITTLGYGDIVPITTRSRLYISLEAILGIVTVGLFLNALAYEAKSE